MTDTAWIALSLVERVGGKTLRALLDHFHHDLSAILKADAAELQRVPGVGPRIAESIRQINLSQTELAVSRWQKAGVQIVTLPERPYPARLRTLEDAPPTLFVRGRWPLPGERAFAVVGTRNPSAEAERIAIQLGAELAARGCVVVSGLAVGIDTLAHVGALAIPEAATAAVLGCGVLNIYPPSNVSLSTAILQRGAVLSEVHPFAGVGASALVARNRIISGLCDGVIVVETGVNGGAMHAARFARAQGRTVYTIDSAAEGNRALLAQGALPIRPDLQALPF